MSRLISVAAGAAIAAALSFGSAYAASASVVVSASAPASSGLYQTRAATVAYGDVDLATAEGTATLLSRIDAAARVLCGEQAGKTMNFARARIFETCRAQATAAAVKTADIPQLTKLATSR
jgi:UrcA family protein